MKVDTRERGKAFALIALIAVVLAYIGWTVMKTLAANEADSTPSPLAAGAPTRTAALTRREDPMDYVRNIERWSQPPAAPSAGNPFREVLPRSGGSGGSGSSSTSRPPRMTGDFVPFGMPGVGADGSSSASVDFPEIHVHGVVIDFQASESFAVVTVGGRQRYARAGDVIAPGVKVMRVTEAGISLTAGKEKAFVEVSRTYKPRGFESNE